MFDFFLAIDLRKGVVVWPSGRAGTSIFAAHITVWQEPRWVSLLHIKPPSFQDWQALPATVHCWDAFTPRFMSGVNATHCGQTCHHRHMLFELSTFCGRWVWKVLFQFQFAVCIKNSRQAKENNIINYTSLLWALRLDQTCQDKIFHRNTILPSVFYDPRVLNERGKQSRGHFLFLAPCSWPLLWWRTRWSQTMAAAVATEIKMLLMTDL